MNASWSIPVQRKELKKSGPLVDTLTRIVLIGALLTSCESAVDDVPENSRVPLTADDAYTIEAQKGATGVPSQHQKPETARIVVDDESAELCEDVDPKRYPFVTELGTTHNICRAFSPPKGFVRIASPSNSFGAWLSGLPLRPRGTMPLTHKGTKARWSASEVAAVVDLGFGRVGHIQDCAASTFRVWSEFLVAHQRGDELAVTMNQKQRLSWSQYQRGCSPRYDKTSRKLSVKCGGKERATTTPTEQSTALQKYVRSVMTWTNSATLNRHLTKVKREALAPGHLILQPNPTGGIGHASIVVDAAVGPDGERRFLIAMGFLPAQDFFILIPKQTPREMGPWCTLDEFEEHLKGLGSRYTYRTFE